MGNTQDEGKGFGVFNHIGFVVEDFDRAVTEQARLFGWEMAPARVVEGDFLVAGETRHLSFRIAWSFDGPPHFEFVESVADTPLQATGVHHVAYWVDDLSSAIKRFETDGYRVAMTRADENGVSPYRFAYVEGPDGAIVELMDDVIRPAYEEYLQYTARGKSFS